MDWLANGDKYAVENFFGTLINPLIFPVLNFHVGVIDVDSIMSRVEDSKVRLLSNS